MGKNDIPSWMIPKLSKKQQSAFRFYECAGSALLHVYNISNDDDVIYPLYMKIHKYLFSVDSLFKKQGIIQQPLERKPLKYRRMIRETPNSCPAMLIGIDKLLCVSMSEFFDAMKISEQNIDTQPVHIQDMYLNYQTNMAKVIYSIWEAKLECSSCPSKNNCDTKKEKVDALYQWRKALLDDSDDAPWFAVQLVELNKKKKLIS